jgi:hypothetical protein
MRILGQVIGVLVILGCAIALAAPRAILAFERSAITPGALLVIAALRIVLGLFFVFAARVSRAPRIVRGLGVLVILAGLATPWFGVARTQTLIDWWLAGGLWTLRLAALVAMALGGLLVYDFRAPPDPHPPGESPGQSSLRR